MCCISISAASGIGSRVSDPPDVHFLALGVWQFAIGEDQLAFDMRLCTAIQVQYHFMAP